MKTFAVSFLCSPSKIRKKTGESPVEVSISVNGERVYSQLPITCNQKSNLYLKEIAKIAKITDKNVTLLTARHSYATYLLSKRLIPVDVVQKMLGHTTNRQSLHYAKMLDDAVFDINHRHSINTNPPAETREDLEDVEYFKKMMGI